MMSSLPCLAPYLSIYFLPLNTMPAVLFINVHYQVRILFYSFFKVFCLIMKGITFCQMHIFHLLRWSSGTFFPFSFFLFFFLIWDLTMLPRLASTHGLKQSSYLCFSSSWDHRHIPPCTMLMWLYKKFCWYGIFHSLSDVKPTLHFEDNSHLVMVYNSLSMVLDPVCYI
jgi:hypothetical protein